MKRTHLKYTATTTQLQLHWNGSFKISGWGWKSVWAVASFLTVQKPKIWTMKYELYELYELNRWNMSLNFEFGYQWWAIVKILIYKEPKREIWTERT